MSFQVTTSHIQYSWSTFLWKHLDRIKDLLDAEMYLDALNSLLNLCKVIPFVREELAEELENAEEEINSVKANTTDPFKKMLIENREAQSKAKVLAEDLLCKVTDLLYDRGYMEFQKKIPVGYEEGLEPKTRHE
jgi:hypothetical protein